MKQAVATFSNAAARSAAITSPVEGQVTYLEDSQSYQYWNSTSWVGLVPQSGNAIINGAFEINQRAFTSSNVDSYTFDRWFVAFSGATGTSSAEAFTLGSAPVAGYESRNFLRYAVTVGNDRARVLNRIEDVRSFAGQTVTLSFWAKGTNPSTPGKLMARFEQNFGTGGSPSSTVTGADNDLVLTADWTRYSFTFSIPSISGKTLGTSNNSHLEIAIGQGTSASTDAWTLDLWGVQLEAGPVSTSFRRNANSIQGELAACQRYYFRTTSPGSFFTLGFGQVTSTTGGQIRVPFPVEMRVRPTALEQSGTAADYVVTAASGSGRTLTSVPSFANANTTGADVSFVVSSGLVAGDATRMLDANTTAAFLAWNGEL
jgi:hypothetical protein